MATKREYKAGEKIILEGTYGEESFLIESGHVLICKETGKGEPVVLAELEQGEVLGEMYVFENAGFRSASAVAKTDVQVQVITRAEIVEELENTPKIIRDMITSLNKRLEGTSQDFSLAQTRKINWERIINRVVIGLLVAVLIVQILNYLKPCM